MRLTSVAHRLVVALAFLAVTVPAAAQQSSATLRGHVADEFGGSIVGATVTISDANGIEKTALTDAEGNFVFPALPPGRYTLRVNAEGFAPHEDAAVGVTAGRNVPLNVTLSVAIEQVEVTVTADSAISTEAENNAGALVLRDDDLTTLPDDPADLAEALQALAGPSAGLNGGDMFIDGFTGGRLPPKESIREIRINRNPFSAEYDRLGFGRIEVFTKPGTDRLRGQAFLNFNDESLNTRNPFVATRAPFQSRRYGGNISGPLSAKRASYFLDVERREQDDNATIRAVVLDPALNIVPFSQTVLTPDRRTTFSPRLDYQLSGTNTLVVRYSYSRSSTENAGVGDFNLLSRAFDTNSTQHVLQLTETAVINQKIINETRFQFSRDRREQESQNPSPTLRVSEAFIGGGSQVSLSTNRQDRFELQNSTSWTHGNHSLKAGVRFRSIRIDDVSPQNFRGTYTFSGGTGPQLDANNQIVLVNGQPVIIAITSIERYRRTILFLGQGLSATEVRLRGGGATQFSISAGNPEAKVTQNDFSPFIQDDWRYRPNLTLSLGLRYEAQSNISDWSNFAPRVAFAWSPGAGAGAKQQKTVIRGGVGMFYDRVGENLTLQENRFNGTNQQQFVVSASLPNGIAILDLFPVVPSAAALTVFNVPQTVRRVAGDIRSPYTIQASLSVERQLPHNLTVSLSYVGARIVHVLRSRNINAPITGTGIRPFGNTGNIFQYESSGRFNQNQIILNVNSRFSRRISLFGNYVFNRANSDTDGPNTFPANQYDLSNEYGRASIDIRHRFFLGGSINVLPWDIRMSPFVILNSGRPFNITTGRDTNGDALFTERPALATDLSKPGLITTRFGVFDPNPTLGQPIITRNFATGPSFFVVNLRLSRTFGFGEEAGSSARGQGGAGREGACRGWWRSWGSGWTTRRRRWRSWRCQRRRWWWPRRRRRRRSFWRRWFDWPSLQSDAFSECTEPVQPHESGDTDW